MALIPEGSRFRHPAARSRLGGVNVWFEISCDWAYTNTTLNIGWGCRKGYGLARVYPEDSRWWLSCRTT